MEYSEFLAAAFVTKHTGTQVVGLAQIPGHGAEPGIGACVAPECRMSAWPVALRSAQLRLGASPEPRHADVVLTGGRAEITRLRVIGLAVWGRWWVGFDVFPWPGVATMHIEDSRAL